MVGEGKCEFCHGRVESGMFMNNVQNGSGRREYADGNVYVGNFENGQRHGHGQMERTDGSVYVGNFNYDQEDGFGQLLVNKTGRANFYVGTFKNDRLYEGQIISPTNGTVFSGTFHADGFTLSSQGKYFWPNGDIYEGTFVGKAMEDDNGLLREASTGWTYVGRWTKGDPVGIHIRTKQDGSEDKVLAVKSDFKARIWKEV